jgi:hypothetical protein
MWLAATIFAAILSVTGVALAEELVGKVVPPFPGGMYQGGGQCIGPNAKDPCEMDVSVLTTVEGRKVGVYAARSAGHDEKRGPLWTVTDVLPYPKVPKGHDLVWGTCRYDKAEDGSVIAVVRNSKQEYLQARGWAYRVDLRSGKLTKLDPMRVDCFNTALEAD